MGRIIRQGKRHCIQNTRSGVVGRCFSKRAKAFKELKKAIRAAKRRRK